MFSNKFYKDLYNDLKNLSRKRREKKFRSSTDSSGTENRDQVVEDIEGAGDKQKNSDGLLSSSNTAQADFDNNIDVIDLADDVNNSEISGSVKEILKEVLTKLKKKRKKNKKEAELDNADEELKIDDDNELKDKKTRKNFITFLRRMTLDRIAYNAALRQREEINKAITARVEREVAAKQNLFAKGSEVDGNMYSRNQSQLSPEHEKLAQKDLLRQNEQEQHQQKNPKKKDPMAESKKMSDEFDRESDKKMRQHYLNDLGSSSAKRGVSNPMGALSDSMIQKEVNKSQAAEKATRSGAAGAVANKWAKYVEDHSHDPHKGGRGFE